MRKIKAKTKSLLLTLLVSFSHLHGQHLLIGKKESDSMAYFQVKGQCFYSFIILFFFSFLFLFLHCVFVSLSFVKNIIEVTTYMRIFLFAFRQE
jgi:hypothetical protein